MEQSIASYDGPALVISQEDAGRYEVLSHTAAAGMHRRDGLALADGRRLHDAMSADSTGTCRAAWAFDASAPGAMTGNAGHHSLYVTMSGSADEFTEMMAGELLSHRRQGRYDPTFDKAEEAVEQRLVNDYEKRISEAAASTDPTGHVGGGTEAAERRAEAIRAHAKIEARRARNSFRLSATGPGSELPGPK